MLKIRYENRIKYQLVLFQFSTNTTSLAERKYFVILSFVPIDDSMTAMLLKYYLNFYGHFEHTKQYQNQ
jgi:hypothetical protein